MGVVLSVSLAILVGVFPPPKSATCQPLSPTGTTMLNRVKSIVSGTDSASLRLRTALSLPSASASTVAVVSSGVVCTSLANAEASRFGGAARSSLLAVAIGTTHYVVLNKNVDVGEYDSMSVYNAQFAFLSMLAF